MSFSIKAILLGFVFVGMWAAVIQSGNWIGYEFAAVATLFAILVSLPLAFFDEDMDRRPFWGGFFVLGFGFFVGSQSHVAELGSLGLRLAEYAARDSRTEHLQLIAESSPYLFSLLAGTLGGVITSIVSRAD